MTDRAAQTEAQLASLAQTAEIHAKSATVEGLDGALNACRPSPDPNVVACYGAWLGERLRRDFGGRWIGLLEPMAPRMTVAGRILSPMDAVARRLRDESAPSLAHILERVASWHPSNPDRDRTLENNRTAWDRLNRSMRFVGVAPELLEKEAALQAVDPWIAAEGLEGKRVLCLGAGGGRQGPLHAATGAREVVVVDLSDEQLVHDREMASKHRLPLRTVQTSMDDLSSLETGSFDLVLQPVSSSYLPGLDRVHQEVARVLRSGGLYVAQHKQPAALDAPAHVDGAELTAPIEGLREEGCVEFLHTLEGLIGGLCRAGFVVEDLVEPPLGDALAEPNSFEARAEAKPPYLKLKARRR